MTSITAWVGVDSRGPSSIYIASDSRISWGKTDSWNYGRKLFSSMKYPDILGYCGDVLFPSLVLGRVTDLIDSNLLFTAGDAPNAKFEKISHVIKRSFIGYPQKSDILIPFKIVYCTRQNEGMSLSFHMSVLSWAVGNGWTSEQLTIPAKSGIVFSSGSGKCYVEKWHERWEKTSQGGTSRAVFGAFCDSIHSDDDKFSGGAAQLVGIYRKGIGEIIGIVKNNECFVFGLPVPECEELEAIEWRNNIFERCDWRTKERLPNAQPHLRPRGLGK